MQEAAKSGPAALIRSLPAVAVHLVTNPPSLSTAKRGLRKPPIIREK